MLRMLSCIVMGLVLSLPASGQGEASYPEKPIRLVVPYPPGGTVDVLARVIADEISKAWAQPVLVESKAGAAGNIGTQLVASAPADGYTLIFGTQSTHGTNSILFKSVGFDPVKDFEPVAMVADARLLLVVNPSLPVTSVKELVEYIKKQPSGLDFASASTGGSGHLAGEMFAKAAGLKLVHVPYKGSGPARTDLIAGHVSFMFDPIGSSLPSVQAGQLRALAVTGTKRTSVAPELPTMQEAGVDGVVIDTWYAIYAPAHTPKAIVRKLSAEINRVLQLPQVAARFNKLGLDIVGSTPEELASRMKSDLERYSKIIHEVGIKAE